MQPPPRHQSAQGISGESLCGAQAAAYIGQKLYQNRACHPFHTVYAADEEDGLFAAPERHDGDRASPGARPDVGDAQLRAFQLLQYRRHTCMVHGFLQYIVHV